MGIYQTLIQTRPRDRIRGRSTTNVSKTRLRERIKVGILYTQTLLQTRFFR